MVSTKDHKGVALLRPSGILAIFRHAMPSLHGMAADFARVRQHICVNIATHRRILPMPSNLLDCSLYASRGPRHDC